MEKIKFRKNHRARMVMLLVLMLVGVSGAWAQTSLGKAEINARPTSTTDEINMETTSGNISALYQGTANFDNGGTQLGGKWYVKLSGAGFIKISVTKGSVVAGDILRVETRDIYNSTSDNQTLGFKVDGSNGTVGIQETDNDTHTLDYILKDGDIRNDPDNSSYDYIKIDRNNNSGCGYHSVEILTNRLVADSFKQWSTIDGNSSTGTASGEFRLGSSVDAGGTVFGDGSVGYLNYVNVKGGSGAIMPDAKYLIIEGNAGVVVRILFNRKTIDGTKANGNMEEEELSIPSNGKLYFDISTYSTFHLNAIKIPYNGSTGNVVNSIKLSNTTYTVTWDGSSIPSGCDAWFTIEGDDTQYKATKTNVPAGASVTFHGTDTGNDTKMINGWNNPGGEYWGWGSTKTVTVNNNISVKPDFQDCILLKLTTSPAEGGTATVTVNGNDANGKKFFQSVKPTFTASVNTASGYSFDGWYDGSTKVSSDISYNADFSGGAMVKNIVAKFKASTPTHKNTPKPTCGGKYFDQSYLEKGANIESFEISGGKAHIQTSTSQVGYVSFFFETPINLTEINKWTVGCENASSIVDYVAFCKEGNIINRTGGQMIFNNNANDRTLDNQYKEFLTSVDEIRIGFKPNTTTTIDYFYLDIKHDLASKKPVLVSPTTNEMSIFTDETLQLRISDIHGFWREFTDDTYTTPTFDHIGHDSNGQAEWKPSYDIANLPVGDYYFGIKDEGTCAIGNHHETELVKVHVEVKQAIHSVNVNGTTRHYDVYAPEGISGNVGVVVSLHGASNDYDNGRVYFNDIAYEEKNTDKRFVVVYPRGLMRQLRGTERGWETYTEDNTEDVDFFKAIVNNLNQEFNGQFSIDYNRIYLAGFSNGGMMAYKAAHQAGDFFKAFASVGGYPVNESHLFHAGKQPTPFIHIQGGNDGIFSQGKYPLSVIANNMVYRNGAHFNPNDDGQNNNDGGVVPSHANVSKEIHNPDDGGAAYYLYTISGMGHEASYNWDDTPGDDVATAMWNFFNKSDKVNNLDTSLKFRLTDNSFWSTIKGIYLGFDNVDTDKYVFSYGGRTKTDANDDNAGYNRDTNNKNIYHSLQFDGGTFGAPHYLKLQVHTQKVNAEDEDPNQYFVVELTKTGDSKPVFRKRYQAGRGDKPLYINFTADSYFNEYKLTITKSSAELDVTVQSVEFHSGKCQDVGKEENPVFFQDVASVLMGMNPIYQPVYDQSFDGLAKEYLPIADIPVHDENVSVDNRILADDLHYTNDGNTTYLYEGENPVLHSTLVESWNAEGKATVTRNQIFNLAHSGKSIEDTEHKVKNAFIATPVGETYTVDKGKGINISQHGIANMPAYVNGDDDDFPSHGMIAFKVQGTVDFTLLAVNDIEYDWADVEPSRRLLKVYYVNDQMDGKPQWLKDWNFFGERTEQNHGGLNTLDFPIRLPQLGKDGTCTVFITYEGNGGVDNADDHDKIWLKGVVFHRPDLKVTIGRTDNLYTDKYYDDSSKPVEAREHNTFLTHYGENKPYVWSFQNVGFKNDKTADLGLKKINEKDGRTYVCGTHADEKDHLLVYSDINSNDNNDKVQFDGRVAGQEHIEFRNASKYNIPDGNLAGRNVFDPIQANGLKVNVTGSGWFKIRCSAPNGPVNMKVYSSTNYGASYINLLREFRVEKTASETDWHEYTVYLKGHINRTKDKAKPADQRSAQEGFWDGDPANAWDEQEKAEEVLRMSLFVVYDKIDGETYPDDDGNHPQLNIHELSWLNEKPADYVFQREEDPKLLTEWQKVMRDFNNNGTIEEDEVVLWWKAANDDDEAYPMLKENGNNAYNRLGQTTTSIAGDKGEKSPESYVSRTATWADGTSYKAYWDIAAATTTNAHTEKAYSNGELKADPAEYTKTGSNTEFDTPVSGSFLRLCAMQNTYVIAHVLPGASDAKVYVLDETGSPIPTSSSDATDKKRLGYVAAMTNVTPNDGENMSTDGTIRIELALNAGKEYFICANGAPVSLARLEVKHDQYSQTKNSTLALTDNADNTSAIATPYNNSQFYCDATLKRKPASKKWFSLVLPFSLNEKKFKAIFGDDAKCIHFTDVDTDHNTVKLTHHYYNMIVAGRPVFVYTSKVFTNDVIEMNDVTLQAREVRNTTTAKGFEFFASYDNADLVNNDLYMNNENAIKYLKNSAGKISYPGMRSFIKSPAGYDPSKGSNALTTSYETKARFLNFCDLDEDEYETGIEELIKEEFGEDAVIITKSTKVYDLKGRVVADGVNINNLPAGIYIVNGKKYIVK